MKLPLGIQTFSEIVATGYYVDKTPFIEKLTQIGKYFFLSRPRRFGKSSFLSTLKFAFEGKKELFKGLYLETHWDWNKKHPVIKISFGGGVTQSKEEIHIVIHEILEKLSRDNSLEIKNQSIRGKFLEIIENLYYKTNQKVVILIDEYDKPILDVIEKTEIAKEVREELKNLYSVIKDSDEFIELVFITGVSKFSKVNLFSGLNNLSDITLDERFATICGYTQTELETTFADLLKDAPLDTIKAWYNG
ncbi:MAG: AAA family ATPase, partial [Leptospiraceae bacterium]|nr:AAA family ATPase [Leptospiraceae bacterium]